MLTKSSKMACWSHKSVTTLIATSWVFIVLIPRQSLWISAIERESPSVTRSPLSSGSSVRLNPSSWTQHAKKVSERVTSNSLMIMTNEPFRTPAPTKSPTQGAELDKFTNKSKPTLRDFKIALVKQLKEAALELSNSTDGNGTTPNLFGEDEEDYYVWQEEEPTTTTTEPPQADFFDTLEFLQEKAQEGIDEIVKRLLPLAVRIHAEVDISTPCVGSFLDFLDALREFRGWALRMIDASGKIPEGVLNGALTSFGSYDECMDVITGQGERNDDIIRGQYCAIDIRPPLPKTADRAYVEAKLRNMTDFRKLLKETKTDEINVFVDFISIRLGLCLPSDCKKEDIAGVTEYISKEMKINASLQWCEVKKTFELDRLQIGIIFGLSLLIAFLLFGTIVELMPRILRKIGFLKEKEEKIMEKGFLFEFIESISVYRNFKKLLGGPVFDENLQAVHGLRFITLLWIVLAHTYSSLNLRSISGLANARFVGENLLFQVVLNASLAGETFFFISGFIIAYRMCTSIERKNGRFSLISFYFRRYWRMTPPYMLVICLFLVTTNLGNGPIWRETVGPIDQNCRTNWWYNALYIGNYLHPTKMCLPHTWFLSVEMQLFFISPMIIMFLYRWPMFGRGLIFLLISASMVITGMITMANNYPPVPLFSSLSTRRKVDDFMANIQMRPFCHLGPFCIGIVVGHYLAKYKKVKLKPVLLATCWLVTLVCNLAVLFGVYQWNRGIIKPPPLETAFYAATCRSVWAMGIAWIIIACATGNGGIFNQLLAWRVFVPLSRLTYLTYLIHPCLMNLFSAYLRRPLHFNHYFLIHLYFAHLVTSFSTAFLLTLAFESPFLAIEKVVSKHLSHRSVMRRKTLHLQAMRHANMPVVGVGKITALNGALPDGHCTASDGSNPAKVPVSGILASSLSTASAFLRKKLKSKSIAIHQSNPGTGQTIEYIYRL